jgi:hypothetical protein
MAETLRDKIITSRSAERMLERVSPIYDNSYVGLWLYEAIGREYDSLQEIVATFPDQLFPQSVTWAIDLWEQRYGIVPRPSQTLEERRAALKAARSKATPFIPYTLKQYIFNLTGRQSDVVDHIADFTFGVYIENTEGMQVADIGTIIEYINRYKHSHMSYDIVFQSSARILVGVETGYWRFPYSVTGEPKAGQLPDASTVFAGNDGKIIVEVDARDYHIPYELSGTKPDVNTEGAIVNTDVYIVPDARGFVHAYNFAGETEAGIEPEYNVTGSVEQSSIRASPSGEAYSITYAMCGSINASDDFAL